MKQSLSRPNRKLKYKKHSAKTQRARPLLLMAGQGTLHIFASGTSISENRFTVFAMRCQDR